MSSFNINHSIINKRWRTVFSFLLCFFSHIHHGFGQFFYPFCQTGPDALASFGGTLTCLTGSVDNGFEGERCFYTIIPDDCAAVGDGDGNADGDGDQTALPLVFDIHGYGSCPYLSALYTGWVELAQSQCFALVLPLGTTDPQVTDGSCWGLPGGLSDGNGTTTPSCCCALGEDLSTIQVTDDEAFLKEAILYTVQNTPIETENQVSIDTKRIYMAGHSNGCMAAMSMTVLHSDIIAAVGCHAGTARTAFPETYMPRPMALIHGTDDPTVPYEGGIGSFGLETTFSLLSEANQCSETTSSSSSDTINNQQQPLTEFRSTSCENNATVVLYALEGVGHFPFPKASLLGLSGDGSVNTVIDTTKVLWDIMKFKSLDVPSNIFDDDIDGESSSTSAPSSSSSSILSSWSFSNNQSPLFTMMTMTMIMAKTIALAVAVAW